MSKLNATEKLHDLVLIRNNKVVGNVKFFAMKSNEFVSVVMDDDSTKALIPSDSEVVARLGYGNVTIRFHIFSGLFLSLGWKEEDPEMKKRLEANFADTSIVSKFDLSFGEVPDHFMNVEGYKSAFSEGESEIQEITYEKLQEMWEQSVIDELIVTEKLENNTITANKLSSDMSGATFVIDSFKVFIPMYALQDINKRWNKTQQLKTHKVLTSGNCVYRLKETGKFDVDGKPEMCNLYSFNVLMQSPHIGFTQNMLAEECRDFEAGLAEHIAKLLNENPYNP